jgi:dipeptidase D
MLLNLDSEEEGAVYIGCAGGKTTGVFKSLPERKLSEKSLHYTVIIDGLRGGHSGLAINKGLGNAIILMSRFLWHLNKKINFDLSDIRGGEKHNAIPREARAEICVNEEDLPILETKIIKYTEIFQNELRKKDDKVKLSLVRNTNRIPVLTEKDKSDLLNLLYSFPYGVFSMSPDIEGLVQTSTNLASVVVQGDGVNILTSQRSSLESSIHDIAGKVISHALLADYDYISKDPYPAWTPNPDSPLLRTAVSVHSELFGRKPEIKAVHAGLECGIIGKKFPGMDMISFGPDVYGAHSPDERVRIESVGNFWNFLKNIVQKI